MSPSNDIYPGPNTIPAKSKKIVWTQFLELTNIRPEQLKELIEIGWVNPQQTIQQEYLFCSSDVPKIHKLMRLCADLEIGILGGTIIVDLLQRIESLEREVKQLRNLL